MKKMLALLLTLCVLLPLTAYAEASEHADISLLFEGKPITCRPISLTQNEEGAYVLILYVEGQKEFVQSQKYKVMSPIYACILGEDGNPLTPNQVGWDAEVPDCCRFIYEVDEMPETLAVLPLDAVDSPDQWYTLTVADIPTETPAEYVYPVKEAE